jgi:hypothetical protein
VGEEVDLITLRKADFLQEFKDEFNDMLRALEQRGAVTVKAADRPDPKQPVPV